MSSDIKALIKQYNQALEVSKQLPALRARIIPALKNEGMQNTKFNFGDYSIGYHSYNDHDGISQKLIKQVLTTYYPNVNSNEFMQRLLNERKLKKVETIKIFSNLKVKG
jgi:hypothetical protein